MGRRHCRGPCWRWVCRRSIEHPGHWETRCARCGTLYCFSSEPFTGWLVTVDEDASAA